MTRYALARKQVVPAPLDDVFAFFAEPRNLARITPPWLKFQLVEPRNPVMATGLRLRYRIRPFGVPQTWVSEITEYRPGEYFVDEQRRGPYREWRHAHVFLPQGNATVVMDTVDYALPFGVLGRLVHALVVRRQLEGIFDYRDAAIRAAFGD